MDTKNIIKLLEIVERKRLFDERHNWSQGSMTYFECLQEELVEVQEEIESGRRPNLEDELGDVFWDFLNLLFNLEKEGKIVLSEVFRRAADKYDERVTGIENGIKWEDVKKKQKTRLSEEL